METVIIGGGNVAGNQRKKKKKLPYGSIVPQYTLEDKYTKSICGRLYNNIDVTSKFRTGGALMLNIPQLKPAYAFKKGLKEYGANFDGEKIKTEDFYRLYDKIRSGSKYQGKFAKEVGININEANTLYSKVGTNTVNMTGKEVAGDMVSKSYTQLSNFKRQLTHDVKGTISSKVEKKLLQDGLENASAKMVSKFVSKIPVVDILFAGASIATAKDRKREIISQGAGFVGAAIGALFPPPVDLITAPLLSLGFSEIANKVYDNRGTIKKWWEDIHDPALNLRKQIANIKKNGGDSSVYERMLTKYKKTGNARSFMEVKKEIANDQKMYNNSVIGIEKKYLGGKSYKNVVNEMKGLQKQYGIFRTNHQEAEANTIQSQFNRYNNDFGGANQEIHALNESKKFKNLAGVKEIKIKTFKKLANGGVLDKPTYALMGEAGAEAIIPLSGSRRSRGLELWQQTGRMLGAKAYANGGIIGGGVSKISKSSPVSIEMGGINITINGAGDTVSIMGAIKAQMPQIANDAANEMAKMLSKVWGNMTLAVEGN